MQKESTKDKRTNERPIGFAIIIWLNLSLDNKKTIIQKDSKDQQDSKSHL